MDIEFHLAVGHEIAGWIDALAELRIRVFRDFPYLYAGSIEYEQSYLRTYIDCEQALAVILTDHARVVGATTGLPMAAETDAFRQPLQTAGIDPSTVFYCGESVLLSGYRGQGLYRRFFDYREKHARNLGLQSACFCAVVRPDDHPLKPADYQPLDPVWRHFGYQPRGDMLAHYDWTDIDQPAETSHPMRFWFKSL